MRYREIASGLRTQIFAEEQALLDRIEKEPIADDALDEREREVAGQMVARGLLTRHKRDGTTIYVASSAGDIWRDRG